MFIDKQCLNKEQVSSVRDSLIGKVVLFDNMEHDNAWNFYNCVATALRMSHPKNWFEDQSECHKVINKYFALTTLTQMDCPMDTPMEYGIVQDSVHEEVQEPTNQLNIFDAIAEVETVEYPHYVDVEPVPDFLLEEMLSDPSDNSQLSESVDNIPQDPFVQEDDLIIFGDPELPVFELPDL
jgi:hypothetical protein